MQVGKVRFEDGTTMYVVVIGGSGYATRRLFSSANEAFEHRHDDDGSLYPVEPEQIPDEEPVDVWTWEGSTDPDAEFRSMASKSLMLLTGEASLDGVMAAYNRSQMDYGF